MTIYLVDLKVANYKFSCKTELNNLEKKIA